MTYIMKISAEDKAIKELISLENKFWQVDKDEVFKTSVAKYFGIEAISPSKVATRLLGHRASVKACIEEMKTDLVNGEYPRRVGESEIKDCEHQLAIIESKLEVIRRLKRYELIAFSDWYAGIKSPFIKSSYQITTLREFKARLEAGKLKEISYEEYDDLSNSDKVDMDNRSRKELDYEGKIAKFHILGFMLWIGIIAFINNNEITPASALPTIAMYFVLPSILRRFIKPD